MRVAVIGASGFVGAAFVRHVRTAGYHVVEATRERYADVAGQRYDIVVDAAASSSKVLAENEPFTDFERSVAHRMRTLADFPAGLHVHVSSVDVYDNLTSSDATVETAVPSPSRQSHYGFHKYLAEQCVAHFATRWLIVRLAGMVGPGLRKNPVFDILHEAPLRIHPDSAYQFLATDDAARLTWRLVEQGITNDVYNVCGRGLISPRRIAELAGRRLDLSALSSGTRPRIVDVSTARLERLAEVPATVETIERFLGRWSDRSSRAAASPPLPRP
jgi:nucleoside-diphosphate-sugar epimerase